MGLQRFGNWGLEWWVLTVMNQSRSSLGQSSNAALSPEAKALSIARLSAVVGVG